MSDPITDPTAGRNWACPECHFGFNKLRNLAIHLIDDHDYTTVKVWDWLDESSTSE